MGGRWGRVGWRPGGGATAIACIVQDSATPISTPSGWTLADSWTGTDEWVGIWSIPIASVPADLATFSSAVAAGTPTSIGYGSGTLTFTGSGGFATVVTFPGDPTNTLNIHVEVFPDGLTVFSGVVVYDPEFDVSVAVVFGGENVDSIGDFTLVDYGGPAGAEIGVWRHEGVSAHSGAWDSTNGEWVAAVFFGFGYP